MPRIASLSCPLCRSGDIRDFARVQSRRYLECDGCGLIHMSAEDRPVRATEFDRYRTHNNHPDDTGYRRFLDRLVVPLLDRMPAGVEGLDYGSGPGPTLSVMIEEQGFTMSIYDPFFSPDLRALGRSYDFITCAEVAEHFVAPRKEFERLSGLLRPGGWLAIMTGLFGGQRFEGWWYARDETHVAFYRDRTIQWIGDWMDWSVSRPEKDVTIYRKGND